MHRPTDLQTVLAQHLDQYQHNHVLSPRQRQVCAHILSCRTPALGGLRLGCDRCDYDTPRYHACRDRHCPKCQRHASTQWCARQREALLPVTYHHLVFTLPHTLNAWVQLHPQVLYNTLFQCVWETLSTFARDPKRLNGQLGMSAVLHTWGETLSRHVHLHCLVPGGALGADGQWHGANRNYLFPVRALSRCFRGCMVSALRAQAQCGELHRIKRDGEIDAVLDTLMRTDWVVFSKPCPTHAGTVIDYLGRYSHRIAISDRRIVKIDADQVHFRYKDYAHDAEHKVMVLQGEEFIRRLLLHVLPKGLMRIRHYGLLANRCRKRKLAQARRCLRAREHDKPVNDTPAPLHPAPGDRCPKCRTGRLILVALNVNRLTEG